MILDVVMEALSDIRREARNSTERLIDSDARGALRRISARAEQAAECLSDASSRFQQGELLTREEYHLLAALDVLHADSYESVTLLHYEDADRRGYIDLDHFPDPGYVRLRLLIGNEVSPENVKISALSPVQRAFFRERLPRVFVRFRRE